MALGLMELAKLHEEELERITRNLIETLPVFASEMNKLTAPLAEAFKFTAGTIPATTTNTATNTRTDTSLIDLPNRFSFEILKERVAAAGGPQPVTFKLPDRKAEALEAARREREALETNPRFGLF